MKLETCTRWPSGVNRAKQRGDALIEALIAGLLVGILVLGITHATTQSLTSQGYVNAQNISRFEMHNRLHNDGIQGLCDGGSVTSTSIGGRTIAYSAICDDTVMSVSISGAASLSLTLPANAGQGAVFSLSTTTSDNSQALFGGDGVVTIGY